MPLSKALVGFIQFKEAEGISPRTASHYKYDLENWIKHLGDIAVKEVTTQKVREYLAYLRTDYMPRRRSGRNDKPLAGKTVRNVWVCLSSFFTWAANEFHIPDPMEGVPAPKHPKVEIAPFTREQVEALLKACDRSREISSSKRQTFTMPRATAKRDRALIKVLLDTGLRAGELCALDVRDYDPKTGELRVRIGKGGKGRYVYIEKNTRREVWLYLAAREDGEDADAAMFIGRNDRRMNPTSLRLLPTRMGQKAGVPNCHPHRMRPNPLMHFCTRCAGGPSRRPMTGCCKRLFAAA